ncbi:hypothetical protein HZC33_02545, partial [Candidatus Wolfebacteria bacterium]|nr:hypothetical protein [Candidatus Wolfebacteria bacterium]
MKKEMQLKLPWFPILDILLVILLGVVLFGCGSKKDNNNNNNNVVVQEPTVILTASETSIWRGKKITLSWEAKNANSCKADWTANTAVSGSADVNPTDTTTYSITCYGEDGNSADDAKSISVDLWKLPVGWLDTYGAAKTSDGIWFDDWDTPNVVKFNLDGKVQCSIAKSYYVETIASYSDKIYALWHDGNSASSPGHISIFDNNCKELQVIEPPTGYVFGRLLGGETMVVDQNGIVVLGSDLFHLDLNGNFIGQPFAITGNTAVMTFGVTVGNGISYTIGLDTVNGRTTAVIVSHTLDSAGNNWVNNSWHSTALAGEANTRDFFYAVAVGQDGVYVGGAVAVTYPNGGGGWTYLLVKYDFFGNRLWLVEDRNRGEINGLAVDSNGYLYTNVGEKINPADGSVVWSIGKTCGESVIVDNGIF